MHLLHQRSIQEHSGPSPDFTSPFKHFKMLQSRQHYHQSPIPQLSVTYQRFFLLKSTTLISFFSLPKMEGIRTQGQGYLKKRASLSYLVDEEMEVVREEDKRKKVMSSGSSDPDRGSSSRLCQVDRCTTDLKEAKQYHRRHKVCEVHAKASSVFLAGVSQRFCQQCSRFHELSEFDEAKRSCRRRLAGHNERRRKSSGESIGEGTSGRTGITGQVMQNQERSRVEMTLPPMSNFSFKRPQIK